MNCLNMSEIITLGAVRYLVLVTLSIQYSDYRLLTKYLFQLVPLRLLTVTGMLYLRLQRYE